MRRLVVYAIPWLSIAAVLGYEMLPENDQIVLGLLVLTLALFALLGWLIWLTVQPFVEDR